MAVSVDQIDKELDLSGEVCPYTFVKSKLALESLESGNILEVLVDNAESAANVPRSLKGEGHEIVGLKKKNNRQFFIQVKKR